MNFRNLFVLCCCLSCFLITLLARQKKESRFDAALAIEQKNYDEAERILANVFRDFHQQKQVDSFCNLLPLFAEIAFARNGIDAATDTITSFVNRVKLIDSSAAVVRQLYMDAAEFYANRGNSKHGYDAEIRALEVALKEANADQTVLAQLQYNLGVYAQRLGQVQLSETHHRKAMQIREHDEKATNEHRYLSYNAMGAVMWYAFKLDSAAHFFNLSLAELEKMPPNPNNKYYRRSIILNNLAGLYAEQGRYTEGIRAQEECIRISQLFMNDPEPHPKKLAAEVGLYQGLDNLAGLFKDVGDFKRAGELLHYSYAKKQERLDEGHADIFISEVLLGQHYTDIREYDKAIVYLEKGLNKMAETNGEYLYWEADACFSMARALAALNRTEEAKQYYNRSDQLFKDSYNDSYDNSYLGYLRHTALFWANNNDLAKARKTAQQGYDYILKVQGPGTLAGFYQLLNLAEVHYIAGQYRESIRYADEGLKVLNGVVQTAGNRLDSVKMQMYHPQAILLHEKARYALAQNKDSVLLSSIAAQLEKAIHILEQRKFLVDDPESINILMAENAALLEFAKEIEMQRYRLTGQENLLDRFINLHESTLYTRIRSRLDQTQAIHFANLPENIYEEETKLKANISATLTGDSSTSFDDYLEAQQKWTHHLERLRKEFPAYYQMRYASLTRDWQTMQTSLPEGQTIIRYYFAGDSLYGLVIDRDKRTLMSLPAPSLSSRIGELYKHHGSDIVPSDLLHGLYRDLWAPLEPLIRHKNVIIIPDGILFATSFDMLPTAPIKKYTELTEKGLVANYAITYQYSLFLVGREVTSKANRNYIAFVPGFDEKAKSTYRKKIEDSVLLDQQYLRLLSQPNTRGLARKLSKILGGEAITDERSTLDRFKAEASGHKIVHIGTHAEYDNMRPHRSRLIFSKDQQGTDSNALFLQDIYACNVQSELTILTACESGKPGFQDGEGMVSLAHAFNYAGSQNILMGLWKIDEKSSSQITDKMVDYLQKGHSAATALQKAKLDYLSSAQGRTAAPAYWAGLVIMGDAAGIEFKPASPNLTWLWISIGLLAVAGLYIGWRRRQSIVTA